MSREGYSKAEVQAQHWLSTAAPQPLLSCCELKQMSPLLVPREAGAEGRCAAHRAAHQAHPHRGRRRAARRQRDLSLPRPRGHHPLREVCLHDGPALELARMPLHSREQNCCSQMSFLRCTCQQHSGQGSVASGKLKWHAKT